MTMSKQLNIGMVGYGFMARVHSHAWASVAHFFDTGYRPVLKGVAARNVSKVRHFAQMWGYESVESDWRDLIARKDIDAIDICVPNDLHAEIAIAAARAGKMVGAWPDHRLRTFVHPYRSGLPRRAATGQPAGPNFREALEANRICDAILASAKAGTWIGL
jgi:predicted dehydrogenase